MLSSMNDGGATQPAEGLLYPLSRLTPSSLRDVDNSLSQMCPSQTYSHLQTFYHYLTIIQIWFQLFSLTYLQIYRPHPPNESYNALYSKSHLICLVLYILELN
jgi:hypothetical protein